MILRVNSISKVIFCPIENLISGPPLTLELEYYKMHKTENIYAWGSKAFFKSYLKMSDLGDGDGVRGILKGHDLQVPQYFPLHDHSSRNNFFYGLGVWILMTSETQAPFKCQLQITSIFSSVCNQHVF